MGYYDGLGGTDTASAYALAQLTRTPVLLVVRPEGSALTLAAQICGLRDFRPESGLKGVLLNDCSEKLLAGLREPLERETGLPVLGCLPPMAEARIGSRHLGLLTAGEIEDITARFQTIAAQMERSLDLDRILSLALPFSPLHDRELPAGIDGLLLPGGYPELYARTLAENTPMRESIRTAAAAGLPTLAECGGFLYLGQSLADETGTEYPMCGLLPGRGFGTGRLQRFGYWTLSAGQDSLLFRAGERVPVHEFHYWDSNDNGADLLAEKADGRSFRCGFMTESLYAAFPHLHLDGELPHRRNPPKHNKAR